MSSKQQSSKPESQTKKFGKGEREIPHHTQKAKKYYPAEDESKPKKVGLRISYERALKPELGSSYTYYRCNCRGRLDLPLRYETTSCWQNYHQFQADQPFL